MTKEHPNDDKVEYVVNQVQNEAKSLYGETVEIKEYFNGLSDVSYCRFVEEEKKFSALKKIICQCSGMATIFRLTIFLH